MARYYLNRNSQPNGDREVHKEGCSRMPYNPIDLGIHLNCHGAVAAAKKITPRADGCYYCCEPCHTS